MSRLGLTLAIYAAAITVIASRAYAFTLTVPGNGCTGFQYTIKKNQYNYTQALGNVTLGTGCTNADLSISKLYIPGACANTRLNNFGLASFAPSQIGCKTVENYSSQTCNTVFDQAPASDIVSNLTSGEFIDTDNICWPADVGFVFVKNNCTKDARVAVEVRIHAYNGPGCDIVKLPGVGKGVGLSPGAIVGIVVGIIAIILLIGALIWCCCCCIGRG